MNDLRWAIVLRYVAAYVRRAPMSPVSKFVPPPGVAIIRPHGQRVPRGEMIAAAMRVWEQSVIEEALGEDVARVLPEAIRLVDGRRSADPRSRGRCMRPRRRSLEE